MLMHLVHTPVHEHRCPVCKTAFEMQHIVDMDPKTYAVDEHGEGGPQRLLVTVACPTCGRHASLTFPFQSPPLQQLLEELRHDRH